MDLSRLSTLKKKLVRASEFRVVLDYFLDHFGEHDEFLALGDRVRNPLLEFLIEVASESVLSREVRVGPLLLVQIAEHRFIHGAFTIEGFPATVIYFEDIRKGMLSIMGHDPSGLVHFVRFGGDVLPPGMIPACN